MFDDLNRLNARLGEQAVAWLTAPALLALRVALASMAGVPLDRMARR